MSRRKQKRPQHLVNADPGGPRLLSHDDHLGMKSPSTSLGSEVTSSGSSSSSPTSLQDCQPPLAPRPSPGGLHAPSLPSESSPPPHWPSHIAPFTTSLPNTHSSLSPDFPHPSLSSQTHSPPPLGQTSHSLSHQGNSHSTMTSPPMGSSATNTTSSSSSSSSSQCVQLHRDSISPSQLQPSGSPGQHGQIHVSPTLAVLLEELRVLQQRQIHQMQITEEICRHVLRLGGAVFGQDNNTHQASGADCSRKPSGAASSSPTHPSTATPVTPASMLLTGLPSSLFPQPSVSKSGASHVNGSRAQPSSTSSSSISSTMSSSVASLHPLSLSLGLPPRYLHEKSSNTSSFGHSNGISFSTPPLPISSHSQDLQPSSSLGSASSAGRPQHVCRFCGKVLSSDSSLQIHLRSHTGERPYQCPVCLSRFTTRGNLKAHFLRHREQNPELSLSLLPPALSEQTQIVPVSTQRRRKRRADDDESFNGVKGSVPGMPENMALGFLSGASARPSPSSLPLPPSVDMALLSTAHSLLQLNRASAAAAANTSGTGLPSSSSSSSSSMGSQFKGAKQQRFDENTPPHSALHSTSPYSQLAHLPKILFPDGTSPHHLALLRPPGHPSASHLTSAHQLPFAFPPFPKPSTSSPSSSSPATSTQTSETSKLQRLVQKLEKGASSSFSSSQGLADAHGDTHGHDLSTPSSAYRREMLAALGLSPSANAAGLMAGHGLSGSGGAQAANQCGVCLRVLSCPRALRLHQATHLGERPFPCKLCGRSFSTKGSLRAHLATHRARPANSRALNSCPLCPRKFTNALVLQHHIRLHLGGQIPPDEDMPGDDAEETESAVFNERENISPTKAQQVLPLALTTRSKSPIDALNSGSASKKSTAADVTSVKTEESEGSTPSVSPPLTRNPPSVGGQDPLRLRNNALADGSPVNSAVVSEEEEAHADPGSTSPLKAPVDASHSAGVNEDADDTPLSLCVPKPAVENDTPHTDVNDDDDDAAASADKPTASPESNPKPPAADASPALSPKAVPETEEASDGAPQGAREGDAAQSGGESDTSAPTEPLPVSDPEPEKDAQGKDAQGKDAQGKDAQEEDAPVKDAPVKEECSVQEEPSEDPEPSVPAPAQPPRSDKPYSCSQCGKAYASRSGLKGHMKTHPAALPNTPSKAQTNDTDIVEDRSKSTTTKNRVQKEEEQGLAKSPEKGDGTDPLPPIGVVSSVADEPMDTTIVRTRGGRGGGGRTKKKKKRGDTTRGREGLYTLFNLGSSRTPTRRRLKRSGVVTPLRAHVPLYRRCLKMAGDGHR
ncbi:Sal-like protein 2 [Liparis tanakae]|uniref:Sal-like protein 2 n=1 Tax=Liparis tanakae TaxID=230148 RepID=A0A4Z2I1L0_9TELE|nr:Sal-like protein 2 [Liparis tanakae]